MNIFMTPAHMISVLLSGIIVGGVSLVAIPRMCEEPLGSSVWTGSREVEGGYILAAPFFSRANYEDSGEVLLLNGKGGVAHRWHTRYTTLVSILKPNGNIVAAMTPPINIADYPSAGSSGLIQEIDWDGEVLWEYSDSQMTHDFELLPDDRIAYIRWYLTEPWFAQRVRGGLQTATTSVWTNELVVVNRDKEVEWTWRPDDHLNPSEYVLNPLVARHDWAHINSVRYIENNPLTGTPAFLLSARNISTVLLIDAETGTIIWQSPKDMLSLQHDATLTASGTVLVFDNGQFRKKDQAALASRVVEIDPTTNKIVWEYDGGRTGLEKAQFASSIMGGAQRLPSGNTLITSSMENTILEVTPDKEVVWRFTNDFRDENGMRAIFKARKYSAENTEWGAKLGWRSTARDAVCR